MPKRYLFIMIACLSILGIVMGTTAYNMIQLNRKIVHIKNELENLDHATLRLKESQTKFHNELSKMSSITHNILKTALNK